VVFFLKVDHPVILRLPHSIRAESSADFILEFVTREEYKLRSGTNHAAVQIAQQYKLRSSTNSATV
jgi:hypothetical protein